MADARGGAPREGLVAGAVIVAGHLSMALGSPPLAPPIEGYERPTRVPRRWSAPAR